MSDKMREALQNLVIRYKTLFQIYAAKAYRPGCDWASDLDLGLAQAREALAQAEQPPTGLEPHHLAAIDRAAAILDARADQYMKAGDYSCELEEADAKSLREVSAWIVRQAERQSPQSSLQWDDCPEKTQYGEGMMEAFVELSKDETMRLVAHKKASALIPAALSRLVAPVVPDEIAKDAARYRWLRDQDYDDGCVIAMKEKHIPRFVNYSQAIDDYIDAAMLAAAPEVKP